MTKEQFIKNIKNLIQSQVNQMANTNKSIGFFKPLIDQIIDKKIYKIDKYIDLLADKEGQINITEMLDKMLNNINTMEPFTMDLPLLNKVEIGGGSIKLQLPFINKSVTFDTNDLDNFRRTLLEQ